MGHKILVVENDELNSDMLTRRLQLENYVVVQAVNGLEALKLAKAEAPDLILMDISLPELDGWEATRRLKSDDATCRIPVIALTAHAMIGDAERFIEAGCDAYESKPIDWKRLTTALTKFLSNGTA